MTKSEALKLYEHAQILGEGWEAAAHALAAALQPAPKIAARRKNKSQGNRSFSGLTGKLPKFTLQACGHKFNSSGCVVCPYCLREPLRLVEGDLTPLHKRHKAIQAGVLAEWAARSPGKKNRFHV